MRNHIPLLKKITASGLAPLLLVAGLPPRAAAAESCKDWGKEKFFKTATVDKVRACLSSGEDPNAADPQGLTALHRAARDTADPAVVGALLDAGANPRTRTIADRTPWDYARTNKKIKGSAVFQRLWITSSKRAKKADWFRVQAVPQSTKTAVRLYQDAAARGDWKIKGRFYSATADSITLMLKNGQTRTFPKAAVRKVLIPRSFPKRTPGWATLAVSSLLAVLLLARGTGAEPGEVPGISSFVIGPPTLIAFLIAKMGPIYDVPPRHRPLLQGDQQSDDQDNASGKQEDPLG